MNIELNEQELEFLEMKLYEINISSEAVLDLLKSKRIQSLSKNKIKNENKMDNVWKDLKDIKVKKARS